MAMDVVSASSLTASATKIVPITINSIEPSASSASLLDAAEAEEGVRKLLAIVRDKISVEPGAIDSRHVGQLAGLSPRIKE